MRIVRFINLNLSIDSINYSDLFADLEVLDLFSSIMDIIDGIKHFDLKLIVSTLYNLYELHIEIKFLRYKIYSYVCLK